MNVLRSFVSTYNSFEPVVSDCWSGKVKNAEGEMTSYSGQKYDDEESKNVVDTVRL